jgi:hypothetical protein
VGADTTEKVRTGVGLDLTAEAGTGADPNPNPTAGVDMRVAVVPAGEGAMVVGLSRHKVGLAGGVKPLRAGLAGRDKPPKATPTDKGLGGVGRACVEDSNSSNLSAKAPLWTVPERS